MKTLKDMVMLGDPRLYEVCTPITQAELPQANAWVADLHNVMEEVKAKYNFGRGIAAPQLGIMKRLIYINIDQPLVMINPEFSHMSEAMFELWDDCMSFPHLLVWVKRHQEVTIRFKDLQWQDQELNAHNDLAELLQHEYDHLEGILCTMRAIDNQSFRWRG